MNDQNDLHRVKKYRFNNHKRYDPSRRQTPQFKTWPWIVGLLIIVILIVGGIKLVNKSKVHTNRYSQSNKTTINYHKHFNDQPKISTKKDAQKHLSRSIDHNKDSSHGNNHTSQTTNVPDASTTSNTVPNQAFSTPHTFDSVQDALNWARASQSEWLQSGYTNFKITSDGQNDYILKFTK